MDCGGDHSKIPKNSRYNLIDVFALRYTNTPPDTPRVTATLLAQQVDLGLEVQPSVSRSLGHSTSHGTSNQPTPSEESDSVIFDSKPRNRSQGDHPDGGLRAWLVEQYWGISEFADSDHAVACLCIFQREQVLTYNLPPITRSVVSQCLQRRLCDFLGFSRLPSYRSGPNKRHDTCIAQRGRANDHMAWPSRLQASRLKSVGRWNSSNAVKKRNVAKFLKVRSFVVDTYGILGNRMGAENYNAVRSGKNGSIFGHLGPPRAERQDCARRTGAPDTGRIRAGCEEESPEKSVAVTEIPGFRQAQSKKNERDKECQKNMEDVRGQRAKKSSWNEATCIEAHLKLELELAIQTSGVAGNFGVSRNTKWKLSNPCRETGGEKMRGGLIKEQKGGREEDAQKRQKSEEGKW
ncbi:hypothetical protein EI94DRAFT_1783391 [Lactarius quietus]|nr:hypothetical protein EI94DRAFT_1783391 [Lactarius quietus]